VQVQTAQNCGSYSLSARKIKISLKFIVLVNTHRLTQKKCCHAHPKAHKLQKIVHMNADISKTNKAGLAQVGVLNYTVHYGCAYAGDVDDRTPLGGNCSSCSLAAVSTESCKLSANGEMWQWSIWRSS